MIYIRCGVWDSLYSCIKESFFFLGWYGGLRLHKKSLGGVAVTLAASLVLEVVRFKGLGFRGSVLRA